MFGDIHEMASQNNKGIMVYWFCKDKVKHEGKRWKEEHSGHDNKGQGLMNMGEIRER